MKHFEKEHQKIELLGKPLFEKVTLKAPLKKVSPLTSGSLFSYNLECKHNGISNIGKALNGIEKTVSTTCKNNTLVILESKSFQEYHGFAVHFYSDILWSIYENKYPKFLQEKQSTNTGTFKGNSDILIKKYIESVLVYFENPNLTNDEILILKLQEIILLLNQTKNYPEIHAMFSNLFNTSYQSFREVIEAHHFSSITINELAQMTNRSLSAFKREFKKIYKTTPATYLRNKKLERSIQLISSTDLRINDIAYNCGFASASNYSRAFQLKYGISPKAYKMTLFDETLN